jgi:hypothetical protein
MQRRQVRRAYPALRRAHQLNEADLLTARLFIEASSELHIPLPKLNS